ncbi:MAG: helix-turn-helix domain-containing protein [Oscillospiraceae bacterium]|nr:helix-turn-helix domain-containing protein [Oscillospiraceae bacterium]
MNDITLAIGEKILIFRRRKGYSRKQLAEILGVTVSTIANYENGVTLPDADKISILADVLGVRLDVLLFDPEAEKHNCHIRGLMLTRNLPENMF